MVRLSSVSRLWALALVASLVACQDGGELAPEDQAIADSFEFFNEFSDIVVKHDSVTVYEGLPHDMFEAELLNQEKSSKPTIEIEGYWFYASPLDMKQDDLSELLDLLESRRNFRTYQGAKACGGFHPDYAAVFAVGHDEMSALLCFGCGEMQAFFRGKTLYCEMSDRGVERLKEQLWKYQVNRPKSTVPNYRKGT